MDGTNPGLSERAGVALDLVEAGESRVRPPFDSAFVDGEDSRSVTRSLPHDARPLKRREQSTEPAPDDVLLARCQKARKIVIRKAARRLELYCGDALAARYETSLGFAPEGHKEREGDGRTPEGEYYVTMKRRSRFHRSLQLNYPNIADADRGYAEGHIDQRQHRAIVRANLACGNPPQDTPLGSYIQIHGGGGGPEVGDWTLGCVALEDAEIERVYEFHESGCDENGEPNTPVIIRP